MKIIKSFILAIIVLFGFASCINNPKVQPIIKQETKKYARIGNEIFLGFSYGIGKNYYLYHLDDLIRKNIVLFDKKENFYYYPFVCGIGTNEHAYNDTIRGRLEPQFDPEFGLYKLSIDLLDYKSQELTDYFKKLYSEKYGDYQNRSETLYGMQLNYLVWKNTSKSISIRNDSYTKKYEQWNGPYFREEYIFGPIVYLNDSIERLINIRDKAIEERKNNELINRSKNTNSEKI